MLSATPDRQILVRLVRNLHLRYLHAERWEEALWTSTHLILLEPSNPRPRKERAFVHLQRDEPAPALEDLQEALRLSPEPDPEIEAWLLQLRSV
jgi:regulator of sirC expression with transglutaminase-like and TPR domain